MTKYVALLRKINVGGNNLITMDQLRDVFKAAGLKNVRTFQQAGNIVFESNAKNRDLLTAKIERFLSNAFKADLKAIIFTVDELTSIAKRNPFKRIAHGDVMFCVVFFFDEPDQQPKLPITSATDRLELIALNDRAAFVVARRKKTGWFGFPNNFVEKQLGVTATTRQWSTVKKLIDFAERLL